MGEPDQAVIFDLDGALIDAFAAHLESWRRLAKERNYLYSRDDFAASFGRTGREIIAELWARELDDDALEAIEARRNEIFRELVKDEVRINPGAEQLVADLRDRNFGLALVSSGPRESVELVLEHLECREAFSVIVTASDVEAGKPEPEIFLEAAERLGVAPQRCVVVEDAAPGVAAGKAAGMLVVAIFCPSAPACCLHGADVIGTSLRQLSPDTLAELIDRRARRLG